MSVYKGTTLLAGVATNTKYNANNLLDFKWTDYLLSDQSWLRADTFSWQDGTVYSDAYDHLVSDIGIITTTTTYFGWYYGAQVYWTESSTPSVGDAVYGWWNGEFVQRFTVQAIIDETEIRIDGDRFSRTPSEDINEPESSAGAIQQTETIGSYTITYWLATDGHKICLPDQETTALNIYNESGVAWYYILDTANTRFKLPRENPAREELIQVIRAKGNGIALGLTNGTQNAGLAGIDAGNTNCLFPNSLKYGSNVGESINNNYTTRNLTYGITTDPTKSGIISSMTDSTSVYKGKQYLYFYVGQFSQSATEQTAGLNAELFNGKMDRDMSNMNPSPIAKETIVGFGMPKYNAMISITSGYSVQTKGFVFVSMNGTNHVTNSISINGTEIAMSQASNQYQEAPVMVQIPVDVGDIITWSGTSSVIALYCPMKGV